MPHWWDGWGWMWPMMIGMALFWILLLVGLVLLIRWAWERGAPGGPTSAGGDRESALDILQKRYARGEITAEQYREMRRELEAGGAAPA